MSNEPKACVYAHAYFCERTLTRLLRECRSRFSPSTSWVCLVDQTQNARLSNTRLYPLLHLSDLSPTCRTGQNKAMPSEYDMLIPPSHFQQALVAPTLLHQ